MSTVDVSYPAPTRQDITIARDVDSTLTFVLTDTTGIPVDITNDTVEFTARDTYGGTAKIATIANTTGHHVDPTNGKTAFTISKAAIDAADTTTNRDVVWVYEVRRLAGGTSPVIVHIMGNLRVVPVVTAG